MHKLLKELLEIQLSFLESGVMWYEHLTGVPTLTNKDI